MFDIRYAKRADGARTAYGILGSGPVLLIPPSHFGQLEWWSETPAFAAALNEMSAQRTVVTYDRHGCGLSDRDRTVFSPEDDMQDIEAVFAALVQDRVDLFAESWGTAPAVRFTADHPSVVRRLVLYGAGAMATTPDRNQAMAMLRRADHDQYIRALAVILFPEGVDEAIFNAFVRLNRFTASVEVQEGLESIAFGTGPRLGLIQVPTLVLHRRDDQMIPFEAGREVAALIPGARFVPLEGCNHIAWTADWQSVVAPVLAFLAEPEVNTSNVAALMPNGGLAARESPASDVESHLSSREREVLRLLGAGKSNQQIADELVISLNTVRRHVSNIFDKTGAANRAQAAVYARDHGVA